MPDTQASKKTSKATRPAYRAAEVLVNNAPSFWAVLENRWGGPVVSKHGSDEKAARREAARLNGQRGPAALPPPAFGDLSRDMPPETYRGPLLARQSLAVGNAECHPGRPAYVIGRHGEAKCCGCWLGEPEPAPEAGKGRGKGPEDPVTFGRRLARESWLFDRTQSDLQGAVGAAYPWRDLTVPDAAAEDRQEAALRAYDAEREAMAREGATGEPVAPILETAAEEAAAQAPATSRQLAALQKCAELLAELVRADVLPEEQAEEARELLARAGVEV